MTLPTNRTTANTRAEHVADHNTLHGLHNVLEGSTIPSVPIPAGTYVAAGPINLVADGDSITAGLNVTPGLNYPAQVAFGLDARSTLTNKGVGGQTLVSMEADAATDIDPLISGTATNVLLAFGGTNDLLNTAVGTVQTRLSTYCANRRAAGWKVLVGTILPRSDASVVDHTAWEAARITLNTWIRANYATWADGLMDFAADPRIGDDGDESSVLYYDGSLVHPNELGYRVIAGIAQSAIATLSRSVAKTAQPGVFAMETRSLWIPPGDFAATSGTPVLSTASSWQAFNLLDAEVGNISTVVDFPLGWLTYNFDVWWSQQAGGTGNVYWRGDRQDAYAGSNLLTGAVTGPVTIVAAPSAWIVAVTRLGTNVALNPSRSSRISVMRVGNSGSDTYAATAQVLGVRLTKAT